MTRLDKAHKALAKALKRLDADQGRIARRNARAAVKAALGRVQSAVDADYPTIRKDVRRVAVVAKTAGAKARKLRAQKLVFVRYPDVALAAAVKAQGNRVIPDPKNRDGYWVHPAVARIFYEASRWSFDPHRLVVLPWKGVTRSKKAERIARAAFYVMLAGYPVVKAEALIKRTPAIAPAIVAACDIVDTADEVREALDLLGVPAK